MKLIHVVPHVGHEASGPSYSVPALCRALGRAGADVTLMTQTKDTGEEPLPESAGFRHVIHKEKGWPKALHPSPDMARALAGAAADADLMHNHSIWLWPNVYPGQVSRDTNTPLVSGPRGALAPANLAHGRLKKRIFWNLFQHVTYDQTSLLHATGEHEYRDLRAYGLRQPVAVVPNGIDVPEMVPEVAPSDTRVLLYLARVHPLKGLPLLLEVWRDLPADARAGWEFHIAGPSTDGHAEELQAFCRAHDLTDARFLGPLYGDDKWRAYAGADIHVHPTKHENFGVVIAEALASGTPVITTKGTPWEGVHDKDCGWWVERTHAALTSALTDAMARPRTVLTEMGARGRAWMTHEFGWDGLASQMLAAYEWVLAGRTGPAPDWVRVNG
ncbi:MAG: glycosyltransferase [Pseudomonadota bacterium]